MQSRIKPTLTQGSIVTDTRSNTHYVVTEYGIVSILESVWSFLILISTIFLTIASYHNVALTLLWLLQRVRSFHLWHKVLTGRSL